MHIKSIVETPEGQFTYQAELTPEQHAFLLEFAIRELVRRGLVPFLSAENEMDLSKVIPISDIVQ